MSSQMIIIIFFGKKKKSKFLAKIELGGKNKVFLDSIFLEVAKKINDFAHKEKKTKRRNKQTHKIFFFFLISATNY